MRRIIKGRRRRTNGKEGEAEEREMERRAKWREIKRWSEKVEDCKKRRHKHKLR